MKRLLLASCLALVARGALADPADYVHTPIVEYGERELELQTGVARNGDGTSDAQAIAGFGLGLKPWWFTELVAGYMREPGERTRYDALEWENVFQLTETGRYAVDAGFLLEIEHPRDRAEGNVIEFGPLLQKDLGRWQLNGNVLFERHVGADEPEPTAMLYEVQAKYRWRPQFEPGVQGFGNLGRWDRWAPQEEQSHLLGPAVFGRVPLGGRRALRYDAAFLFGLSPRAADQTFRLRVEYEF